MSNLYLTLDLKKKILYSDDRTLVYSFNSWDYSLNDKTFELDGMNINYDQINEFIFERDIKTDVATVEIEDNYVEDVELYNRKLGEYLESDFIYRLEKFIADKDLPDGEYEVKYNYYFDFSDDGFICEILEVLNDD